MDFRKIISALIITLIYPIFALFKFGYVAFVNALTIFSFILLIIGLFYWIALKGDFDIMTYYASKFKSKTKLKAYENKNFYTNFEDENLSFEEFKERAIKRRKNSFNYPFLLGFVYLLISIILTIMH